MNGKENRECCGYFGKSLVTACKGTLEEMTEVAEGLGKVVVHV